MARPKLAEPNYRLANRGGVFYVVWHEAGRTRGVSTRTADERTAKQWLAEFRAGRAYPLPPRQPTVTDILRAYLADRRPNLRDPGRIEHAMKQLAPTFGLLQPHQISVGLCRNYASARRKAEASNGTIRRELIVLKAGLEWGRAHQWISLTPTVELPPAPPARDRWISRDQAKKLIAKCQAEHLKLFVILALNTAARAGAILELTWDRVDLDRGIIDFGRGHGRKRRTVVPANDTALAALKTAAEIRESDYVIEWAGKPVASVQMAFRRAARKAGVKVSPHDLRRTAATWMALAGVPMEEIARMLGDTVATTEKHYARWHPAHLRQAAAALG